MAGPGLPVTIDTTYADDGGDASVKLHQQHHDTLHAFANKFDTSVNSGADDTFIQAKSGLYVPRTVAQVKTDLGIVDFASTALEASLGGSDGTATSQTLTATTFTTINLPTENTDPGGNFASNIYTVPADGLYACVARVRLKDESTSAVAQLGIGVGTSNGDGPHFAWYHVPVTSSGAASRLTFNYIRQAQFSSGSQLRLYAWASTGLILSTANLSIIRAA